ncbi:class I SAM-dependent methyltransferase [Sphingobium sp. CAP-1]|uniref:class I SAM-dependent methyltransferase n=1 Tax=Sphingobium sp. CAP-1 TaxID=2676077 RepID=UPI0012BB42BF|nr:SAM-dependent methyltransferase [Sphingobium sp. CAP-1]QGP79908.1 class I SAM-dependent methyltransferase [Sphingobium sp. CAP-1]
MSPDRVLPDRISLPERLARQIASGGPISVAHYIGEANQHYYATRDPLGADGDFTTAPEISQMFGELVGLALADIWMRSGRRPDPAYVELGPGRGTLAADAIRAMARAALAPKTHLVETSPALRGRQLALLPHAIHHDSIDSLPDAGPLLVVANEFFDALPVRQCIRVGDEWRERVVIRREEESRFIAVPGYRRIESGLPPMAHDAPDGAIIESPIVGAGIAYALAQRIARQGGAAIIIDYGYEGPALGDTLQAVKAHQFADPFADPGEADLTTHVDFTMLGNMARQAGLRVHGAVGQGAFLRQLGIDARADQLARAAPDRAAEVEAARHRLTDDQEMGILFKVMAWTHPDWADPAGFDR